MKGEKGEAKDGIRPEVKRAVAALEKLGELTLNELRAAMRAVLGTALGDQPWWATVAIHGANEVVGRSPFQVNWTETSQAAKAVRPSSAASP